MCSELRRGDCDFFFCHRRRRWEIDTVAQLKAAEECKKKKVREKEREKEGEIGEQKSFSLWRFDSPHLLQNISLSSIFSSPRVRGHTQQKLLGKPMDSGEHTEHWTSLALFLVQVNGRPVGSRGCQTPVAAVYRSTAATNVAVLLGWFGCFCFCPFWWAPTVAARVASSSSSSSSYSFGISFSVVTFSSCLGNPFSWLSTHRENK